MFKKLLPWYLLGLVVLSLAFIYGCGAAPTSGGGGGGITGNTYFGTQSGGDYWKWIIDATSTTEGTFWGKNFTMSYECSGTYEVLPSKFCKALINYVHKDGLEGPSVGDTAYFLEFPNTMLLVKPNAAAGEDKVIVCAAAATSAPANGTICNFITIPWAGWLSTNAAYGTAEVISGSSYTFEVVQHNFDGNVVADGTGLQSGFQFSNGMFSNPTQDMKIFITPSGVFAGDAGPGRGGIAGATVEAMFADEGDAQGEVPGKIFRGVLFNYDPTSNTGTTEPIGATGEANGSIHGSDFLDIESDVDPQWGTHLSTLEFTGVISPGMIKGTLENNGELNTFVMVVAYVGDPQKLAVIGITTQEGSGNPQNFIVIEQ